MCGFRGVCTARGEASTEARGSKEPLTSEVAGDMVALCACGSAVLPLAGQAQVVGALAADVVVAQVGVEHLGVGEDPVAVLPEATVAGRVGGGSTDGGLAVALGRGQGTLAVGRGVWEHGEAGHGLLAGQVVKGLLEMRERNEMKGESRIHGVYIRWAWHAGRMRSPAMLALGKGLASQTPPQPRRQASFPTGAESLSSSAAPRPRCPQEHLARFSRPPTSMSFLPQLGDLSSAPRSAAGLLYYCPLARPASAGLRLSLAAHWRSLRRMASTPLPAGRAPAPSRRLPVIRRDLLTISPGPQIRRGCAIRHRCCGCSGGKNLADGVLAFSRRSNSFRDEDRPVNTADDLLPDAVNGLLSAARAPFRLKFIYPFSQTAGPHPPYLP
jgi:hypothetical protein